MDATQLKDKYKNRSGFVFVSPAQISETSKQKFQHALLATKIITEPFEFIETCDNVTFFVCKEGASCKGGYLLQGIQSIMQLRFLNGHLFHVDTLQAFLGELK